MLCQGWGLGDGAHKYLQLHLEELHWLLQAFLGTAKHVTSSLSPFLPPSPSLSPLSLPLLPSLLIPFFPYLLLHIITHSVVFHAAYRQFLILYHRDRIYSLLLTPWSSYKWFHILYHELWLYSSPHYLPSPHTLSFPAILFPSHLALLYFVTWICVENNI